MLEIDTLGGFTLRKDGHLIVLSRRLEEALLVYLLNHPKPVPRATLIDLLWNAENPKLAGNNFRATLSRLRKAVGDYLIVTRQAVGFDFSQPHRHDAAILQTELSRMKNATGIGDEGENDSVGAFGEALKLYSADFLAGFELRAAPQFEAWVLLQQERLRLQARSGFQQVADYYFARGNYASALGFAARLTEIDPLNEEAHRLTMRLLLRNRERNSALKQFATCQQILADELNVEPTETTRALYERILSGNPDNHNLQGGRGAFFGRKQLIPQLIATLGYKPCLISLLGQGGVGKSRLAQAVAQQLVGRLSDGVFFISLVSIAGTSMNTDSLTLAIIQAISDAIGLSLGRSKNPKQTLLDFLKNKELLLILDNFEHVLTAANLVDDLLLAAKDLRIIVTSRERLWLRAEQMVQLDGLAYTWADDSESPAVALLAERSQITIAADTKASLTKLASLVEGLPLALEMIAGQLAAQSLKAVADELSEYLASLTSRYRDTPSRHATMQAVFDYSWALLDAREKQILARLGVFSAEFDTSAAATICQATTQTLARLANHSLLTFLDQRWRLHPLIREFAHARCADFPALQRKHATYYLQYAAQLDLQQQTKLLDAIWSERTNLQAAWRWASNHGENKLLEASQQQLFEFYTQRSRYAEGVAAFELALEQLDINSDAQLSSRLFLALGRLQIYRSLYAAAERALNNSLHLSENADGAAAAEAYLGAIDYYEGRFDSAETHLTTTLAHDPNNGFALNLLANIRRRQGRHDEARKLFAATITSRQAAGDQIGEAMALNNLGIVDQTVGDFAAAREHYEASGRLLAQLNNPQGVAATLLNAGSAALRTGDLADARRLIEESVGLKRGLNNPRSLALSLCTLAEVALADGSLTEAQSILHEALTLAHSANAQPVVMDLLQVYALLAQKKNQTTEMSQLANFIVEFAETDELRQRAQALLESDGVPLQGELSAEMLPQLINQLLAAYPTG